MQHNSPKRMAVIGTGVMGRNHARTIARHPELELTCVIDSQMSAAVAVAEAHGSGAVENLRGISAEFIDGAVIATPSHLHAEMAEQLMHAGVDVLVEKPIALNVSDADRLAEVSAREDRVLMVGHIELFNPTVESLISALGGSTIRRIVAERLGSVADTSRLYHNVVEDLMVHDLAVVLKLLSCTEVPKLLSAFGRSDTVASPDPADAHFLIGELGVDAYFRASRSYPGGKKRTITVETDTGIVVADLLDRSVQYTKAGEGAFDLGGQRFTQDSTTSKLIPPATEPLYAELDFFYHCMNRDAVPEAMGVSAVDAIRVLRCTDAVLGLIRSH